MYGTGETQPPMRPRKEAQAEPLSERTCPKCERVFAKKCGLANHGHYCGRPKSAIVADDEGEAEEEIAGATVACRPITDLGRCFYCGEPADTIDHVQPKSATTSRLGGRTVPACRDCNCTILRDLPIYTETERGARVAAILGGRVLAIGPEKWTPEEARKSLRGNLLAAVLGDIRRRARLRRRAEYAAACFGEGNEAAHLEEA